MKKLMIPAVALAMFMASCGGVKSDASKFCDKIKEQISSLSGSEEMKRPIVQADSERKIKLIIIDGNP
jgi:hypothetical protein